MKTVVMVLLLAAQHSSYGHDHGCVGDFVYQGSKEEVSIGVRVRSAPDVFEVLFSDFGNVQATQVDWRINSAVAIDKQDNSSVVLVCTENNYTLVLPSDKYSPARTFPLRKVQGSLWEVGKREGWLEPDE